MLEFNGFKSFELESRMSSKKDDLYSRLTDSIIKRYRANASKSLLEVYQVDRDFLKIDPETLEFAFTNRDGLITVLEDPDVTSNLVSLFVNETITFTYENNQFIHLDQQEQKILSRLYQQYLEGMKVVIRDSESLETLEANLTDLVKHHFQDLSSNISRFFDSEAAQFIQENIILKKAVCSEYSPAFQLSMLGICLPDLMEPVLDLGCGKSGQLVKYLNTNGIQAIGIDRIVERSDVLREADWFALDDPPQTWGTILSHMAFSNHFLFHHRYKNGHPEDYARRYVKILSSLKSGGSFYYSPGLPFIEQFLPVEQYTVYKHDLTTTTRQPSDLKIWLQEDIWYIARVIKK